MGVFFFGMGYSARATAKAIHQNIDGDIPIAGTTRTEENAESLADSAYRTHVFDGQAPGQSLKPDLAKNTREAAASDFISPKVTPRAVVDAFVAQAMKADPILADLKNDGEFNDFKPSLLGTPTLILFGSEDPGVNAADAGKMLARMPVADKQIIVLPGADHAAHVEDTHDAWVAAIINFIARPGPRR